MEIWYWYILDIYPIHLLGDVPIISVVAAAARYLSLTMLSSWNWDRHRHIRSYLEKLNAGCWKRWSPRQPVLPPHKTVWYLASIFPSDFLWLKCAVEIWNVISAKEEEAVVGVIQVWNEEAGVKWSGGGETLSDNYITEDYPGSLQLMKIKGK